MPRGIDYDGDQAGEPGETPSANDVTEPGVTSEVPLDDDARAEARWLYDTRCSYCHGPMGRGDGDGAVGLDPRPRDFTRSHFLSDRGSGHVETVILRGGTAVGLSALMPPNPDLKAKPDVVAALRDIVRDLAQPHGGR